jgi:hypothetical protein
VIDVTPELLERTPLLANAVADVLEESAKRVERDGFAQGFFWDVVTGKYCTRGHYTQVVLDKYRSFDQIDGVDIWKSVIAACDMVMTMHLNRGVASWNDIPGRTDAEVVAALRASSAEARMLVAA